MFNLKVTESSGASITYQASSETERDAIIARLEQMGHGKAAYTERVPSPDDELVFTEVEHNAEFQVEVTDLSQDPEWQLAECRRLRASEYPPITDFADAQVHAAQGDPDPLKAYFATCKAIKAKYPKPEPQK